MNFGIEKALLVVVVILLFFGARRIPELAGSMGKGIREFKRNLAGSQDETGDKAALTAQPPAGQVTPTREAAPSEARPEPKRLIR
jgi:sec-independent protein translocase protein TatA